MFEGVKKRIEELSKIGRRTPSGKNEDIYLVRDWRFFLMSLFLSTILILGFGFYEFYKAAATDFSGDATQNASVSTLSREKLDAVIQKFNQKDTVFRSLKNSRPKTPTL